MSAYDLPLLDTSQRQKFGTMLDLLAPVQSSYAQIQGAGDAALKKAFAAAQANIGAQFAPAMRMAQSRLGGSPLLADSGYANRLNRQLQGAAFGDLSRAYGDAASQQAMAQQSALERLIQARFGAASGLLGGAQKRASGGDKALGFLGNVGGSAAGAFL